MAGSAPVAPRPDGGPGRGPAGRRGPRARCAPPRRRDPGTRRMLPHGRDALGVDRRELERAEDRPQLGIEQFLHVHFAHGLLCLPRVHDVSATDGRRRCCLVQRAGVGRPGDSPRCTSAAVAASHFFTKSAWVGYSCASCDALNGTVVPKMLQRTPAPTAELDDVVCCGHGLCSAPARSPVGRYPTAWRPRRRPAAIGCRPARCRWHRVTKAVGFARVHLEARRLWRRVARAYPVLDGRDRRPQLVGVRAGVDRRLAVDDARNRVLGRIEHGARTPGRRPPRSPVRSERE